MATQTATSDPVSPGLNTDFAVSRVFDHEVSDGFSHSEISEVRDGLPSTGVSQGQAHSGATVMNFSSDCKNTAFTRISRVADKCEEVRQSDFRVSKLARPVSAHPN